MERSEDYLQREFLDDQRWHKYIRGIICQTAGMFSELIDDGQWPYELEDGKPVPPPKKDYSQSTNAMILFSLTVAGRWISSGPLIPILYKTEPVGTLKKDDFEAVWARLGAASNKRLTDTKDTRISYSSSFGWDDPFTLGWLIEIDRGNIFSKWPEAARTGLYKRAQARTAQVFNPKPDGSRPTWLEWDEKDTKDRTSLDHSFPALRYLQLQESLKLLQVKAAIQNDYALRYVENRIHEQLSKFEVQDGNCDASELVFAMEGLLLTEPNSVTRSLLDRIFHVIAQSQDRTPHWRPVKPMVATPQGYVLFPVSVETATSLLRCCSLIEKQFNDLAIFSKHVGLFRRYSEWLVARFRQGTADVKGKHVAFAGWYSEHVHMHPGIHLWETSQAMLFLVHYAAMLDRHIARSSLKAAQLVDEQPWETNQATSHVAYWNSERKIREPLEGLDADSPFRIFSHSLRHLIAPRDTGGNGDDLQYSLLLYGPPGTGKTAFAKEICKALKWPLITVTPSDFIRGGESEVEARAKTIFDVLEAQFEAVILFDEIDRTILDRGSQLYTEQSDIFQFMTPSMLTKIKNLRERKRVLFIIATNYEERIDPAAKRRGRLDAHILLPPPDNAQRQEILESLIAGKAKIKKKDLPKLDLTDVIKSTRLMVFDELKELVDRATVGILADQRKNPEKLVESLRKIKISSPAISLLSYRSRYEDDKVPQKPNREYLVLLYLRLQSGELDEKEKELTKNVLKTLSEVEASDWSKNPAGSRDQAKENMAETLLDDTKIVPVISSWIDANL